MNSFKDYVVALFEPFTNLVRSDGGDGGGLIVCRTRKKEEVAQWYEEWNKTQKCPYKREDHEANINFVDNQEGIVILDGAEVKHDSFETTEIEDFLKTLHVHYKFGDYILIV